MLNLKKRWVAVFMLSDGEASNVQGCKKSNFKLVFDFILEQLFTSKTYKRVVGRKHRSHHSARHHLKSAI